MKHLPNELTVSRIILIFCFVVLANFDSANPTCIKVGENTAYLCHVIALVVAVLAGLTDLADGYLARKYHVESDFGRLMDPLADKIFITATFVMMLDYDMIPGCSTFRARPEMMFMFSRGSVDAEFDDGLDDGGVGVPDAGHVALLGEEDGEVADLEGESDAPALFEAGHAAVAVFGVGRDFVEAVEGRVNDLLLAQQEELDIDVFAVILEFVGVVGVGRVVLDVDVELAVGDEVVASAFRDGARGEEFFDGGPLFGEEGGIAVEVFERIVNHGGNLLVYKIADAIL